MIVEFYERESGEMPVREFLDKLDVRHRAKSIRDIEILQQFGSSLREPFSKHISEGIFELRTQLANNITRIFYFFYSNNKIILTNGFVKKTQKTPKKEIELALKYKLDYERRADNEK